MNPSALVSTAVMGTRRKELPPAASSLEFLCGYQGPAAAQLLVQAGTLELQRQVGYQAQQLRRKASTLSPDDLNAPSASTSRMLGELLGGFYSELLPEMLELLAEQQQHSPAVYVPVLLERAHKNPLLRPALFRVLGQRGIWLALQNPDWHYATSLAESWDGLLREWQSKLMYRRQGILQQTRLRDAKTGLALVESTWKSESLSSATWIIRGLATGLSMLDEPFLERSLDDRNATIRQKAIALLACLPDSRLCQRMTAAAEDIVCYRPRLERFDIHLPTVLSHALQRDGVSQRNWRDSSKVRSAQIADLFGVVPLPYWTRHWGKSPAELVKAASRSADGEAILLGLCTAAERQAEDSWLLALLAQLGPNNTSLKLIPKLSDAAFTNLLERHQTIAQDALFIRAVQRRLQAWTLEQLSLFLSYLQAYLAQQPEPDSQDAVCKSAVKLCGRFCPATGISACLSEFQTLTQAYPAWQGNFQEGIALLEQRERMLKSFEGG